MIIGAGKIARGMNMAGLSQSPSTNVGAVARIGLETSMVGSKQNRSTNGGAVTKVVLATSMEDLNLPGLNDGIKNAPEMNMADSNQSRTEDGVVVARAIMAEAKITDRDKAAVMMTAAKASIFTEISGKDEAAQAVVLGMTTTTGLMAESVVRICA